MPDDARDQELPDYSDPPPVAPPGPDPEPNPSGDHEHGAAELAQLAQEDGG